MPSHLHYQESIGNFFNLYQPLAWAPARGECEVVLSFIKHIFGEQYELGLDYLTLLYRSPTQKLPVLCLVSKERKTGKTTFLNLLKLIFGRNTTFNGNSDFRSQFNSDWMNTLVIAVDEVLLDRKEDSEKIKNLSTAKTSKIEAKNKDKRETEFFGKFVLCSNNEETFIVIDATETRYWIRKIPVLQTENIHLLDQMSKEIPQFLFYLLNRPLSVPTGLTRKGVRGMDDLGIIKNTGQPEVDITLDQQKMAQYGVATADANTVIAMAVGGQTATTLYEGVRTFDISVRFPEAYRKTPEDIGNLLVPTASGTRVPIKEIATITRKTSLCYLLREGNERYATLKFAVRDRDMGSTVAEAQQKVNAKVKLKRGYRMVWRGDFENQQRAEKRLALVVPISLALIFLLLFVMSAILKTPHWCS